MTPALAGRLLLDVADLLDTIAAALRDLAAQVASTEQVGA
jgi:hypothetical protein